MISGLYIAIPTQGSIRIQTALSLFGIVAEFVKQGLPHTVNYYSSADIVLSRNRLAAAFLAEERYSHLLFVDSDMEFDSRVFNSLARKESPFTACAYPKRGLDIESFRRAVEADLANPTDARTATSELLSLVANFALRSTGFDGQRWKFELRDGYVSLPGVGLGVALIAREVFTTMIDRGCVEAIPAAEGKSRPDSSFGFFNPVQDPTTRAWLSEDISFCKRWVADCGGTIWAPAHATVKHIGSQTFSGCLAEKLKLMHSLKDPATRE